MPGLNGLNCWDLNGNGGGDPEEDLNDDGAFDAIDCQGSAGPPGASGAAGATYTVVTPETPGKGTDVTIDGKTYYQHIAWCDAGDMVLSGGYAYPPAGNQIEFVTSRPVIGVDGRQGWETTARQNNSEWSTTAVCLDSGV